MSVILFMTLWLLSYLYYVKVLKTFRFVTLLILTLNVALVQVLFLKRKDTYLSYFVQTSFTAPVIFYLRTSILLSFPCLVEVFQLFSLSLVFISVNIQFPFILLQRSTSSFFLCNFYPYPHNCRTLQTFSTCSFRIFPSDQQIIL